MATVEILPDVADAQAQVSYPTAPAAHVPYSVKPIIQPVGSAAAGGPTVGQLLPVGTR